MALGLLATCATFGQGRRQLSDKQRRQREILRWELFRPVVRGKHAAVSAGTATVTQVTMRVLQSGGNAVDAGVAALLAGAVTEFSHFGFGGEAPLLIRTPDGQVHSIAGVGTAPALMTLDFFLSRAKDPELELEAAQREHKTGHIPSYGTMPALVPGMVDAALLALQQFGTLSFRQVAEPAASLAESHPIDSMRSRSIAEASSFLRLYPTSLAVFAPDGRRPRPGDLFRQSDLAATIRSMMRSERAALESGKSRAAAIDAVRDYFYRGPIAREIADFVKSDGGLLRYEDFAAFRLEVEPPLMTEFHGYQVYKSDFWTQGAVLLQALNILEGYDLNAIGWNTPAYIHHLVEALKLAFADRDAWYADPKFVSVPSELLSKTYASARRSLINPRRASTEFRPGTFGQRRPVHPSRRPERRPMPDKLASKDTTSINIASADGMLFSASPSGAWMPAVIAGTHGHPANSARPQLPDDSRTPQCGRTRQAAADHADADTGDAARRAVYGPFHAWRRPAGTGPLTGAAGSLGLQLQPAGSGRGPALPKQALRRELRRPCHGAQRAAPRRADALVCVRRTGRTRPPG